MAKREKKGPDATSAAYDAMLPAWTKIQTLIDGTDAMRAAGHMYLPQHEEESNTSWAERLQKATLLNMLQMTLDGWVGKPFSDPIKVGDDVPKQIQELLSDIDLQGNNLDVFSRNWFDDGLAKGFSHVLVEFPRPRPRLDGLPRTLEDDNRDKLRPYLVHVKPENCIFAYATTQQGKEVLSQVRIREQQCVMDGFEEKYINRIRVLEPGKVTIYEERPDPRNPKKTIWVKIEEYAISLDFIPLVTFYSDRQGLMLSKPPLSDLADLNIEHWQSKSDQNAVLTVARFPILAVSGAISDDKLTVGPNQWLNCPDPAGRFYYVEHTGKAIAAGRQSLLDLEEQMASYGALFLKKRPGGASATKAALDTAETTSPLQDMAIRFQSALNEAIQFMGAWMKVEKTGTFTVNTDFGLEASDAPHLVALGDARKNKDISRERYTKELHRLGCLSDDYDSDEDAKLLDEEKKVALKDQEDTLKVIAANTPKPVSTAPVIKNNVRVGRPKTSGARAGTSKKKE